MSAIGNRRDSYYPPVQNGKEKRPGLVTMAQWALWEAYRLLGFTAADKTKLNALYQGMPAFRVNHNANQAIASGGAGTNIAFNTEVDDPNGFHDTVTNNHLAVIPATLGGLYLFGFLGQWNAVAGGNRRIFTMRVNGTQPIGQAEAMPNGAATFPALTIVSRWRVSAGDNVGVYAFQDSGVAINVLAAANNTPEFWGVRLSD